MKKYLLFTLLAVIFLAGCNLVVESGGIKNRWDVSYCDAPFVEEHAQELLKLGNRVPYQQMFIGSKFVFRKDNQFDLVLFDNYYHGTWQLDDKEQWLQLKVLDSKETISIKVDSITNELLQIRIDSANFIKLKGQRSPNYASAGWFDRGMVIFRFSKERERFAADKDPYSIENNKWRIKPLQAETDKQLKERLNNHLQFFRLLFVDALDNDRSFVAYNWFVSPLTPAVNGIGLKNYKKVKQVWETYFYDSIQAKQGYDILFKAFDKEIKLPEKTDGKYKYSLNLIEQVIANMDK